MASCEKCWRDSMGDPDRYGRLVRERNCTPEEQAGPDRAECPKCSRKACHQFTGECMACGYDARQATEAN